MDRTRADPRRARARHHASGGVHRVGRRSARAEEIAGRREPELRALVLAGVLTSAFGAVLLAQPLIGVVALLGFIAAYAILTGITVIAIGMNIHRPVRRSPTLASA